MLSYRRCAFSELSLRVFLDAGKTAEFALHDDDGVSFDFEQNKFALHRWRATIQGDLLRVETPRT